uniref:ATP synthase subunit a n=1 Tax=Smaug warreni TaxID=885424 RepID=Q6I7W9_9SAUR|nr:ATP synthase F0 subunit 6 [Smaug warreni]BAD24755.1 ATPase subunit 6 [Smaug warreni]
MTLALFDQFLSPKLLFIPLLLPAMTLPALLLPTPNNRLSKPRLLSLYLFITKPFIKQLMSPVNTPGHKWTPLLLVLMLYLTTLNTLGLLPYTFTPTTQLSMNMGLAIPLWLATVFIGLRNQPTTSLAHFLPEGTPTPLVPILVLIETVSLFIRPVALGVRLTANLTAGHLLIQLISLTIFTLSTSMNMMAIPAILILFLLSILEVAVAIIQAYVFTLLLSLYLQENV